LEGKIQMSIKSTRADLKEKFIKTIYEVSGKHITFRQDEVRLDNGIISYRDVVEHPGAVVIVAVNPQKELLMVKQYRYAIQQESLELPAGKLEPGEEPLQTAQRELEEETGYKAMKWSALCSFYTTPGFTNEIIHLFMAEELVQTKIMPDPDEIIENYTVDLGKLYKSIVEGKIYDAKTIIGIFYALEKCGLLIPEGS